MVFLVCAVTVILFLPLIFEIYVYFDGESERLNFGVYLYSIVKVFGGYVVKRRGEIYLHYSDKRALFMKNEDLQKFRIKPSSLFGFELFKSRLTLSVPKGENAFLSCALASVCSKIFLPVVKTKKPFSDLSFKLLCKRDDGLKVYYDLKTCLNLLGAIIFLARNILYNEKRK